MKSLSAAYDLMRRRPKSGKAESLSSDLDENRSRSMIEEIRMRRLEKMAQEPEDPTMPEMDPTEDTSLDSEPKGRKKARLERIFKSRF